ncbi:MAG: M28 family peptidase [Elusimicrobia bacterium]|nr:M28 family peptidase [Elusimicrobiota bacterium]
MNNGKEFLMMLLAGFLLPAGISGAQQQASASKAVANDSLVGPLARPERDPYPILEGLVRLGNRHAGAARREEAIALLTRWLSERGLETRRQDFQATDPRSGRRWPMSNVVGRWRPEAPCRFLLGSHFDARHEAEMEADPARKPLPIEGANDSGSGVAVILALAARFEAIVPKGAGVDVVFFDGEEMGYPDAGGYCMGSRRYAEDLPAGGRPRFGVILDMVAAPDAVLKVEDYSYRAHPRLVDALWEIGRSRSKTAFSLERWGWIRDDHVSLSQAGVPSVLIIGFNDPRWHTSQDTLAHCSPRRMRLVAGALEEFIMKRSSEFLGGCLAAPGVPGAGVPPPSDMGSGQ